MRKSPKKVERFASLKLHQASVRNRVVAIKWMSKACGTKKRVKSGPDITIRATLYNNEPIYLGIVVATSRASIYVENTTDQDNYTVVTSPPFPV